MLDVIELIRMNIGESTNYSWARALPIVNRLVLGCTMLSRVKRPSTRDRRRDIRRAAVKCAIVLNGTTHKAADLSLGGLLVLDHHGWIAPGKILDITIVCDRKDKTYAVDARVAVVRGDPARRQLACRFVDIDGKAWKLLEKLLINRI